MDLLHQPKFRISQGGAECWAPAAFAESAVQLFILVLSLDFS